MDILSHQWKIRHGDVSKKQTIKHERKYIDFVISGQPLSEILHTKERDMISMFGWAFNKEYENRTLKEFIGQAPVELETGRTIIYGCSECGDIGCGAITAEILHLDEKVVWRHFGYENDYSGFDLADFKKIGPFEFAKVEYLNEFKKINSELNSILRKED